MTNIAFCGLRHGHIFSLYDLAKANPEVRVVGAWEEDEAARAQAMEKIAEPFYGSYEQLLADPRVEIVAVGDYYGVRGQRIIQALRAGRHVLSDKPLCTRLSELDEIERLCREKGLFVGCMLDLRYDPALRLAARLVRSGELGEIHAVNFTGQHPLNYGIRPMWYFEPGKHGGTLNDLAIHGLDAVRFITGLDYRRTLYARQYNAFAHEQPDFPDCAQLMGEYENGAGLVADVSYSAPNGAAFDLPSYWRFSFWGEKGMLECRLGEGSVLLARSGGPVERLNAPAVRENCLSELLQAIRGQATVFPPNDALLSARVALEVQGEGTFERRPLSAGPTASC